MSHNETLKRWGAFYYRCSQSDDDWDKEAGVRLFRSLCMAVSLGSDYCCHTKVQLEVLPWPWLAISVFHRNLHIGGVHWYSWEAA